MSNSEDVRTDVVFAPAELNEELRGLDLFFVDGQLVPEGLDLVERQAGDGS